MGTSSGHPGRLGRRRRECLLLRWVMPFFTTQRHGSSRSNLRFIRICTLINHIGRKNLTERGRSFGWKGSIWNGTAPLYCHSVCLGKEEIRCMKQVSRLPIKRCAPIHWHDLLFLLWMRPNSMRFHSNLLDLYHLIRLFCTSSHLAACVHGNNIGV